MKNYNESELKAYGRGIDAGHLSGEYSGKDIMEIKCPYPDNSKEADAWDEGFSNAFDDEEAYT